MDVKTFLIVLILVAVVIFSGFQFASLTGLVVLTQPRSVQLSIENGNMLAYMLEVEGDETAFDLLKGVAVVDYEMYSTGIVISEINGVETGDNHHWICLVNGELPENPCDFYQPNEGDMISFVYLTSEEALGYFK